MDKTVEVYGKVMCNAVRLNKFEGVNVYVCMQGNTQVISVTVEENKTQIYNRKEFMSNMEGIEQMKRDIYIMAHHMEEFERWKEGNTTVME